MSALRRLPGQLSLIDHLEADFDAQRRAARSLRQSILRHAFTGHLMPQNPNDEPASALLVRIAAERAGWDAAGHGPRRGGRRTARNAT